jgi:hypothetical protein
VCRVGAARIDDVKRCRRRRARSWSALLSWSAGEGDVENIVFLVAASPCEVPGE